MVNRKIADCIPENGLILIIGRRGSGKSTLGYCILEYLKDKRDCYVYNFPKPKLLPSYISVINNIEFPENSVILIDEAYMNFSSRESLSKRNRFISNLNGLARQKNLLTIYITQESTSVDINIIRGIEVIFIKALSINQVRFERKEMRNFLYKVKNKIDSLGSVDKIKKAVYVVCDLIGKQFEGLVENANDIPSFWSDELSRVWKGVTLNQKKPTQQPYNLPILNGWYQKQFDDILNHVYNKYNTDKTFDVNKFDKAYSEAVKIFLERFPFLAKLL